MTTPARTPRLGAALTAREIQCLAGAANGYSNAQIAAWLFLGEDTVKSHFRRVYRKLGATDRAHAVWLAGEQAILTVRHVHAARPVTHLERAS